MNCLREDRKVAIMTEQNTLNRASTGYGRGNAKACSVVLLKADVRGESCSSSWVAGAARSTLNSSSIICFYCLHRIEINEYSQIGLIRTRLIRKSNKNFKAKIS